MSSPPPPIVIVAGGAGNDPNNKKTRIQNRKKHVVTKKSLKSSNHEKNKDETEEDLLIELIPKNNKTTSNSNDSSGLDSKVVTPPTTAIDLLSVESNSSNGRNGEQRRKMEESEVSLEEDDDDKKKNGDEMEVIPLTDDRSPEDLFLSEPETKERKAKMMSEIIWLAVCFFGIMISFVCYGLLLEHTTSGDEPLHELSFLFVTSLLYTITAAAGRYVRAETPTTIPPARFAILGLTSMGSTFCSVRSLRFVIYPIQVLAKSCKPVPVMIMGAFMGKKYPLRKYFNVALIVAGVGMFMGGGHSKKKSAAALEEGDSSSSASQFLGILLLFISLCFDGGTGAYEDKLMSVHSVGPFDLMYNIQLGKTIIAGVGLLVFNQVHTFLHMCQEMGFLLVALGISGAMGQVFIFVTIAKFGALTCSIIGLARKVTTLVASIYFYGHTLTGIQSAGLLVSIGAMVMNFWGKNSGGKSHHHHGGPTTKPHPTNNNQVKKNDGETTEPFYRDDIIIDEKGNGDVELGPVVVKPETTTV